MFLCETCAYFTPSEPVLNEHIRLLHSQAMESKFKFGVASAKEKVLAELAVIYQCAICGFSSRLESDLTLHVKNGHSKRIFMCDECPYFTEDIEDLRGDTKMTFAKFLDFWTPPFVTVPFTQPISTVVTF